MSANDLQQSLLNSIQLLSDNAVSHDNSVKSIKATIVDIKDEGLNTYMVSYGGNQFEAAATSTGVKYQTGDIVYVLIPDGDFSQKKLIIGAVAARATMYSSTNQDKSYRKISDNLITSIGDITLKSWIDTNELVENLNNFGNVFSEYLQSYRTVLFSAKVRTDIDKDHQVKGNYGISLSLPFIKNAGSGESESVNKILVMDVDSMQGNPYAFIKEQTINLYFDIESEWTYDLTRQPELRKMVDGFGYLEPKSEDTDPDIYFRDIKFQIIENIPTAAQEGYSLSLSASKGRFFLSTEENSIKTLTPTLYLDGNKTSIDTWYCYWLVEDASIKIDSEGYLPLAGMGWKCLNNKTNITYDNTGKEIFNYVTNKYNYLIYQKDIKGSLKYKCLLAQDDNVVSTVIEIKNLKNNIETSLFSATGSTIFPKNTGNINLISRLYYPTLLSTDTLVTEWQRFDKNENNVGTDIFTNIRVNDKVNVDGKEIYENEISYPCSSLDELNLIKCTFYCITTINGEITKYNLGTAQISVTTSENLSYRILVNNGDVIYKYDADGDSPLVANYDGPISSRVKTINPISYRLFKEDGSELTNEDYNFCRYIYKVPVNSMIEIENPPEAKDGYYYIDGYGQKELKYSIAPVYNKNKNDNTILLTLEYAGNVISEAINIRFIKDGESGTNGTKYATIIKYGNYAYGEKDNEGRIQKLQAVYVNSSGWKIYNIENERLDSFGTPQLSIEVYKDGKIESSNNYDISWGMFDSIGSIYNGCDTCFDINNEGRLFITKDWSDFNIKYVNIIQAKIKIKNAGNNNENTTLYDEEIYAYYPIEITRVANSSYINSLIPTLDGGFSEVLYASDGTNPAYDSSTSFVCTNNIEDDASNYYSYEWDSSVNLIKKNENGREINFYPISKYDNGNSNNWIRAIITRTIEDQQALDNEIASINNDINDKLKEIEYYRTVRSLVRNVYSNFDYNNYISSLNNSQLLLLYIKQSVDIFNNLINSDSSLSEDIINYCNREDIGQYILIDLNTIVENNKNKINLEWENIHSLIKGGNLDNLTGLQDCIILLDESSVTDVSIYYQLKSMIDRWNQLISVKYLSIYQALIKKENNIYVFQSQINNLNSNIYLGLKNYVTNTLVPLTNPVGAREPDQVFINLTNTVNGIIERLDNSNTINSYADIQEKVIQSIQSLIYIYSDTEYQENHYAKLQNQYEKQKEELEKSLEGYEKADAATPTTSTSTEIVHIRPIIMLYNAYEFSNLNSWDGNKIYTDQNNNTYLLAPQVGAGKKDNQNKFTGIVLGNRKTTFGDNTEVGLFGYSKGVQTIFLDANTGNATFGASENTINITPTSSEIHFSNTDGKVYSKEKGSIADGFYLSADGLEIGRYFSVDAQGNINAQQGTFAGELSAPTGTIGGFHITPTSLYSTSSGSSSISDYSIWINTNPNEIQIRGSGVDGESTLTSTDGFLKLFDKGLEFYDGNSRVGKIGRIKFETKTNYKGVGFLNETYLTLGSYLTSTTYRAHLTIVNPSHPLNGWSESIIFWNSVRLDGDSYLRFSPPNNTTATDCYIKGRSLSDTNENGLSISGSDCVCIGPGGSVPTDTYFLRVGKNSNNKSAVFSGEACFKDNIRLKNGKDIIFNTSSNQSDNVYISGTSSSESGYIGIKLQTWHYFLITSVQSDSGGAYTQYLLTVRKNASTGKSAYFTGEIATTGLLDIWRDSNNKAELRFNGNPFTMIKEEDYDLHFYTLNNFVFDSSKYIKGNFDGYLYNNTHDAYVRVTETGYLNFIPYESNIMQCGTNSHYWLKGVATSWTNPSDRKLKNHIKYIDDDEAINFISNLKPVEFTFKNDEDNFIRMGFYAQDVYQTSKIINDNMEIVQANYINEDRICKNPEGISDESLSWSMNYSGLIAPLVKAVQKLIQDNIHLKGELDILKQKLEVKGC